MDKAMNEMAPAYLPSFLPSPDGSDHLFTVVVVLLIVGLLCIGTLYLRLHALPEQMAHHLSPQQITLVAVLGLLALFTHQAMFWVAALLLAVVRFPDLETPLTAIAQQLGYKPETEDEPESPENPDATTQRDGSDHV